MPKAKVPMSLQLSEMPNAETAMRMPQEERGMPILLDVYADPF